MFSLFDMDGTLVDSTDGVVGAWESFKEKYPDLDVTHVLSGECDSSSKRCYILIHLFKTTVSHGVRTVENLRRYCGVEDPEELEVSTHVSLVTLLSPTST